MSRQYFHLTDFTSGQVVDPVQGLGDNEDGLHGPAGDLGPDQGHPVAAALDDVAIAAEAVADAAMVVAEAPPEGLDSVDGAGDGPPTDNAGSLEHVYTSIIYGPVGGGNPGLEYDEVNLSDEDNNVNNADVGGNPGLNYEEIRISDNENNADVTDEDADSLLVNRSVPYLVNGHDDGHDSDPEPERPHDVPLQVLHEAPAESDHEASHTPGPPAELPPSGGHDLHPPVPDAPVSQSLTPAPGPLPDWYLRIITTLILLITIAGFSSVILLYYFK